MFLIFSLKIYSFVCIIIPPSVVPPPPVSRSAGQPTCSTRGGGSSLQTRGGLLKLSSEAASSSTSSRTFATTRGTDFGIAGALQRTSAIPPHQVHRVLKSKLFFSYFRC